MTKEAITKVLDEEHFKAYTYKSKMKRDKHIKFMNVTGWLVDVIKPIRENGSHKWYVKYYKNEIKVQNIIN